MRTSANNSPARTVLATVGFLVIAAFFLTTEHRAHLFGLLPFLLLLACPFLHMLGHGGHGAHGAHGAHGGRERGEADKQADPGPAGRRSGTAGAPARDAHAGHVSGAEDTP